MAELYLKNGKWQVNALCTDYQDGLQALFNLLSKLKSSKLQAFPAYAVDS